MKRFKLKGVCPYCHKENEFLVYAEELKNNYHFSCTFCEKETKLKDYKNLR